MNRYSNEILIGSKSSKFINMFSVTAQETPNKTVYVSAGTYLKNGTDIVEFNGQNTSPITFPETGSVWVMVSLDKLNTINVTYGQSDLSNPQIPKVTSSSLPLALIYIKHDDIVITGDMIYDVKPYLNISESTGGTSSSSDPSVDKSYWYNYTDDGKGIVGKNTLINATNILLSKDTTSSNGISQIQIDGQLQNTYCIYDLVGKTVSLTAKTDFEKNRNDIINWDCNFITYDYNNNTHYNTTNSELSITNSTATYTFYPRGYTLIKLKNPESFTINNSITATINSTVIGTINNKNDVIEYITTSTSDEISIVFTQSISENSTIISICESYYSSVSINNVQNDVVSNLGNIGMSPVGERGGYRIYPLTTFSNSSESIDIYCSDVLIGTLSNNNISIPLEFLTIKDGASITAIPHNFTTTGGSFELGFSILTTYYSDMTKPQIIISDNAVTVTIQNAMTMVSGVITLTPKLYDENLNLIKTNNSIHLVLDSYNGSYMC